MIGIQVLQETISNMIEGAVGFVPRLLTTILVVLVGWLIGKIIATGLERLANKLRLESLLEHTGIKAGLEKVQINRTGSQLLGLLFFWIIFLSFTLVGLENLGLGSAIEPLRNLIAFLPRLFSALVILTLGILLAQFLGRVTQAALEGMAVEFYREAGQGVNTLLVIMVVVVVLEQLGLDASIMTNILTNVITLVVAGLALAFGLGGRDVVRNILAGYYAREQFSLGDTVVLDEYEGTLEAISTLNAEINAAGEQVIVPNTRLTDSSVKIKARG